jgi:hypothetical protein
VTVAEVFVDAGLATASHGEAGVTLSSGLRAGPNPLRDSLQRTVRIIFTGENGKPIGASDVTRVIPFFLPQRTE